MIRFCVLGPFVVLLAGQPLDLGPRKQRAVLAALTIEANRVVSLDRLIDELWGEEPPAQAIGTLQAYVSNLRRVLEPNRTPREPPRVLVTQNPGYVLRVPEGSSDAAQFEAAAAEGRRLLMESIPAAARLRLNEALDLWRGSALADFAFESFAQAEAARLDELRLVAREDRFQADLDLGAHDAVVPQLEAAVSAHPLRERLIGMLMLALYRAGRQAEALRAYQTARNTLVEELGIDPGPALRRLESDILAQASSLDWRRAGGIEEKASPPAPEPPRQIFDPAPAEAPVIPVTRTPIVGRRQELARLLAGLDRAEAGRGGTVLVQGEPGIGKTRLVQELLSRAAARGLPWVWGGSIEGGGTPAYWPWVEIIRSLISQPDRVSITASAPGMPELAQVVPEIQAFTGPLEAPAALDPETARLRLFDAMAGLLGEASAQHPLVVVLDDLQWADGASFQLLSYLAPKLKDSRLLILGTYRPAEIGPGHPLRDCLATLSRHQVADRVQLEGLSELEVADLIEAATGTSVPGRTVAAVRSRTEGNPFFVTELARLLASEHDLGDSVGLARAVPAGVRDVVRRRLRRLPEETMAVLSLAAVDGRDFELRVLEAAAELDSERTLELVEAALMSGLVLEHQDAVGRFRFSHDLVRETILEELTASRRARLHARVGEAIDATYGEDAAHALELANHFFQAAPAVGAARAIPLALRAAEVAYSRLAYEQAEEQLFRALELLRSVRAGQERDRQELKVQLRINSMVMMTRGYAAPDAGKALERAKELCLALGESRELVPVLWGLFAFHFVSGR
ncbi:MAG: BTAD domain-containing putative transcriptional regulator, partial [Actinomycetota bacterium]